ncbi:MAG: PKD domain-containing protein [Chitinophagales bacterium]
MKQNPNAFALGVFQSQPIASAGENRLVILPETTAILDGNNSSDPFGGDLTYNWTQIYGPSNVVISDAQAAQPMISGLL